LIKKNINKNVKIHTYHVDLMGEKLSYILTKSWIIAEQMGIEEKIMLPIFNGIQDTHEIKNISSIKKLFKTKAGINENTFNNFWNSLTIEMLIQKQNKNIKKCELKHVPTMLINGKYIIDYSNIEEIFKDNFSQKYIRLIQFLIKKK